MAAAARGQPLAYGGDIVAGAVVEVLLEARALAKLWQLQEIKRWQVGACFPGGHTFALEHADGTVTIIGTIAPEPGSDRSVYAGLISLFITEVPAGFGRVGAPTRRILAVALPGRDLRHLVPVCAVHHVVLEPLGHPHEYLTVCLMMGPCHGHA